MAKNIKPFILTSRDWEDDPRYFMKRVESKFNEIIKSYGNTGTKRKTKRKTRKSRH